MDYREQFTDEQLAYIIEQGLIYMCACPAQVAEGVRKLREIHRYQGTCINNPDNESAVHGVIANSVALAHQTMQDCLEDIIRMEGWNRTTLEMPAHLRQRQLKELLADD